MSNNKNSAAYVQTTLDVVPAGTTMTGTISTSGKIVNGVGTLFRSQLKPGDWIVKLSANEIRKVVTIGTDINLSLDSAFTADIAPGAALYVVRSRVRVISVLNSGAGNILIDGIALALGVSLTWDKGSKVPHDRNDFIDPIIVDATGAGNSAEITTLK